MVSSCRLGINLSDNRCQGWGAQGRNLVATPSVARQLACLSGWLVLSIPLCSFYFHLLTSSVNCQGQRLHCSLLYLLLLSGTTESQEWEGLWHVTENVTIIKNTTLSSSPSDSSWPCTNTPLSWKFSIVNSVLKSAECHSDWTYISSACVSSARFKDDLISNLWHHLCAFSLSRAFCWDGRSAHRVPAGPSAKGGLWLWAGGCQPAVLCSAEGEEHTNLMLCCSETLSTSAILSCSDEP